MACKTLRIPNLQLSDTGTYTCEYPGAKATYTIQITVVEAIPAANRWALLGLATLLSLVFWRQARTWRQETK
ncbi:MAG: immunoglobulin domain-containing protein [bacterium]|nr:immunoglobulin domain-containing protein [bacterium]